MSYERPKVLYQGYLDNENNSRDFFTSLTSEDNSTLANSLLEMGVDPNKAMAIADQIVSNGVNHQASRDALLPHLNLVVAPSVDTTSPSISIADVPVEVLASSEFIIPPQQQEQSELEIITNATKVLEDASEVVYQETGYRITSRSAMHGRFTGGGMFGDCSSRDKGKGDKDIKKIRDALKQQKSKSSKPPKGLSNLVAMLKGVNMNNTS